MTISHMNNHDKFIKLYELYSHDLLNYAAAIVKSRYIAEELVQDSYVKILKHIDELESPTSARTRRYLVVTVRNTCLDYIHRAVSTEELADYQIIQDNPLDTVWDDFNVSEIKKKLQLFLESLSDSDRNLFEDAIIRGHHHKDLAVKYGLSETNVAVKIFRFRMRFRKFLEKKG